MNTAIGLKFNLNPDFKSKFDDIDWSKMYDIESWVENGYMMPDKQHWPKPGCPKCGYGKED